MDEFAPLFRYAALTDSGLDLSKEQCAELQAALAVAPAGDPIVATVAAWAAGAGLDEERAKAVVELTIKVLSRINLRQYAADVRTSGATRSIRSGWIARRHRASSSTSTASRRHVSTNAPSIRRCRST